MTLGGTLRDPLPMPATTAARRFEERPRRGLWSRSNVSRLRTRLWCTPTKAIARISIADPSAGRAKERRRLLAIMPIAVSAWAQAACFAEPTTLHSGYGDTSWGRIGVSATVRVALSNASVAHRSSLERGVPSSVCHPCSPASSSSSSTIWRASASGTHPAAPTRLAVAFMNAMTWRSVAPGESGAAGISRCEQTSGLA